MSLSAMRVGSPTVLSLRNVCRDGFVHRIDQFDGDVLIVNNDLAFTHCASSTGHVII